MTSELKDTKDTKEKETKEKLFDVDALFNGKTYDTDKIHEWRNRTKDERRVQILAQFFIANLRALVQNDERMEQIKKEFATFSDDHNKSPTLEKYLFMYMNPKNYHLDSKLRSTYKKMVSVFRQIIPAIGPGYFESIGADLKKLIDYTAKLKDDSMVNLYSDFRKPVKMTFGESKNRYKSPQYEEFRTFTDTSRAKRAAKVKKIANLSKPVVTVNYSKILDLVSNLITNKTDENASMLLLAALTSGLREEEILDKNITIKQRGTNPFEIEMDGLAKQHTKERSKTESWRPLIGGMTAAELIEIVRILRTKNPKKDFRGKTGLIRKYFPEAFLTKFDDDGNELPGASRPNTMRQLYIATISDTEKYNPKKEHQRAYFTEMYFKHDPDFSTPLFYNKYSIKDDLVNPEPKKAGCASEAELQALKAENLVLAADKKKADDKAKTKSFEKKTKKHRSEEELIAEGKAAIAKLEAENKMTSRNLREELKVGNDKISWLMQQLKRKPVKSAKPAVEKETKEKESKTKEVKEQSKEPKDTKKKDKLTSKLTEILQQPDLEISADNSIIRPSRASNISLSNSS